MRSRYFCVHFVVVVAAFAFVFPQLCSAATGSFLNRITGNVFDQAHNPVPDVDVELQNEVGSLLSRTKTNSAGSFIFVGVSKGHFQIKVLPLRRGLIGETKDVEVTPLYSNGSDSVYVDFYLRYEKRSASIVPTGPGEAIFVQEVPDRAKNLFESGLKKLERHQPDALTDIHAAVDAFPTYFDALGTLGREYVKMGEYQKGYPYLIRALDISQRSATNYYSLAFAFYKLKQIPAAIKAAQACVVLNGASADANLLFGTVLRINKNLKEAEPPLLKALNLSKARDPEVHWQLALLYNRTGRNTEAIDHLEQYLKLYPDSPDISSVHDLIARLKASGPASAKDKPNN